MDGCSICQCVGLIMATKSNSQSGQINFDYHKDRKRRDKIELRHLLQLLISHPKWLQARLCSECGVDFYDVGHRACTIVRSDATYGGEGTVVVEFEGSPPRFPIILCNDWVYVYGKAIKESYHFTARILVMEFLHAHPANPDRSPVWIGTRQNDWVALCP